MSWMNNKLSVFCAVLSAFLCNAASANIEPSSYDAKSFAVDFALQTAFASAHVGPSTDPNTASDPLFYAEPEDEP